MPREPKRCGFSQTGAARFSRPRAFFEQGRAGANNTIQLSAEVGLEGSEASRDTVDC